MAKIAIVYHSGYGHTKVISNYIKLGIESTGTVCKEYNVDQLKDPKSDTFQELSDFDCIVFGAPTYMGSASAGFKAFMDATSGLWAGQKWKDKFAAGFTVSGSFNGNKDNTLIQLFTLAAQHSMIWISQGILPTGKSEKDINRLGSYIGLEAQADNASPDITPPEGDRKTAENFGKRIAEFVSR